MLHCHIVRDLLPSYIDSLVSEETATEVAAHLEDCPQCRQLWAEMSAPVAAPITEQNDRKALSFLRKLRVRTMRSVAIGVAGVTVVFGILAWVFAFGVPVESKDVQVRTEFQQNDGPSSKEWSSTLSSKTARP